jgi:hypothetical protein
MDATRGAVFPSDPLPLACTTALDPYDGVAAPSEVRKVD